MKQNEYLFYGTDNTLLSAKLIYGEIKKFLPRINSIIDVGCGMAAFAKAFQEDGVETVTLVDHPSFDASKCLVKNNFRFVPCDLDKELPAPLQADLLRAGVEPWAWVINNSLAAADTTSPLLRQRAGHELHHDEGDGQRAEKRGHHQQDALEDVGQLGRSLRSRLTGACRWGTTTSSRPRASRYRARCRWCTTGRWAPCVCS